MKKKDEKRFEDIRFTDSYGRLHNIGGPALIKANGDMYWYKEGKLHNEYGPAIVTKSGRRIIAYYREGKPHRPVEQGPQSTDMYGNDYYIADGIDYTYKWQKEAMEKEIVYKAISEDRQDRYYEDDDMIDELGNEYYEKVI